MFIDDSNLLTLSMNTHGIYHVSNHAKNHQIDKIMCSGEIVKDLVFLDVSKGFAIQTCKDINGHIQLLNDSEICYKIIYGDFKVILKEGSKE